MEKKARAYRCGPTPPAVFAPPVDLGKTVHPAEARARKDSEARADHRKESSACAAASAAAKSEIKERKAGEEKKTSRRCKLAPTPFTTVSYWRSESQLFD